MSLSLGCFKQPPFFSFFFLICTACLQAKAPLPSTPTSSSLWCHLRSWSPGRPRCPHAAPQIGEPTPLPPSAPPWADLNTLSIFLVFLSLVTLSPSLHPSTSAHSAYFKGLILSFRRLRESTELPESGTCRFQPRFTTSAGFCMLSC